MAIGLFVAGAALVLAGLIARKKSERLRPWAIFIVFIGVLAIAFGVIVLASSMVDVTTKIESGSGDDSG